MKKRLDVLVYAKGLRDSREKADAIIMAVEEYRDTNKTDKSGKYDDDNLKIEV